MYSVPVSSTAWTLLVRGVRGRGNATVYALGSSYSPSGVKMISFQFGSTTEHLVPESIVFSANFQAPGAVGDAGSSIFPANPDANVLFERIDIRLSGQLTGPGLPKDET